MKKFKLVLAILGMTSLSALAVINSGKDVDVDVENDKDCRLNSRACKPLASYEELKKLCIKPLAVGNQLKPTVFKLNCQVCWTEWELDQQETELPRKSSSKGSLVTNKGKMDLWKTEQIVTPEQMECGEAFETIYKIPEVEIDLTEVNCDKVLSYNNIQEFNEYLQENYCTKGNIQELLDWKQYKLNTGRYINACDSMTIKLKKEVIGGKPLECPKDGPNQI